MRVLRAPFRNAPSPQAPTHPAANLRAFVPHARGFTYHMAHAPCPTLPSLNATCHKPHAPCPMPQAPLLDATCPSLMPKASLPHTTCPFAPCHVRFLHATGPFAPCDIPIRPMPHTPQPFISRLPPPTSHLQPIFHFFKASIVYTKDKSQRSASEPFAVRKKLRMR